MKFTWSWLKEHLETDRPLSDIVEKLSEIGLEVESVTNPGAALKDFLIGHVVEARPHPDADRLQVCTVACGKDKPLQIVCGAPNARPGIKVVLGLPGTYVPALDFKLKEAKIRGVESFGMLCSTKELGLGDEHDGIMELPADAPIGESFSHYYGLDDPLIDIAVTPNRPDCLGVRGVARDLAAAGMGKLKSLSVKPSEAQFKGGFVLQRDNAAAKGCPHYMGRLFKGVKNGPSPDWLKRKLNAIGMRSISTLVDITNYVSVDLCRPLHVFDAQKLKGPVAVRLSKKDESFKALDENTYTLDEGHVVIADSHHIAALGGVMGGLNSGCTEETTDVLLECAYFDPGFVARAGRSVNLHTDARHRFERGVDPLSTSLGMDRATALILELCGGETSEVIELGGNHYTPKEIEFNYESVEKRTGMVVAAEKQNSIFEKLGFSRGKNFTVPSFRPDISIPEDMVEEVARLYGYNHLPEVKLESEGPKTLFPEMSAGVLARHQLAARGYMEVVTWSMVSEEEFHLFGGENADVQISNPISVELSFMRPSVLPHLLRAVQKNIDQGLSPVSFFEIGPAYQGLAEQDQQTVIVGAKTSKKQHTHWSKKEKIEDVFDVKADVIALLRTFNIEADGLQTSTEDLPDWYHPGRAAWLQRGPKNKLALFGEVHPNILKYYGIKERVFCFEVQMDALMPLKPKAKSALVVSDYPKVERDFSFLFPENVEGQSIIKAIKKVDSTVVFVDIFDIYRGNDVPAQKKSIALRVSFDPKDKTFTDPEIKDLYDRVVTTVETQLQGKMKL